MVDTAFVARAESHLGRVLGWSDFRIASAEQISGNGLSRAVYKLVSTSSSWPDERHQVLLLEQAASPVEPNREAEFAVLRALAEVPAIPVAPAVWVEADPEPLGAPFLLTGLLPGTTNPKKLLDVDSIADPSALIERTFEVLGSLAALDVASLDLGPAFNNVPARADVWQIELSRCEQVIRDRGGSDCVVTAAALRRLRRTPPPLPAKLAIVHGDYRLGNYLFDRSGLTGVIDWEMVHLGDPLEDLAWSFLPLWEFGARPGRVGGCLSRREAVAAWERTSGLRVDPVALAWWLLYCHIKSVSIWLTARHLFSSGRVKGVLPAVIGYAMVEKQETYIVELLKETQP